MLKSDTYKHIKQQGQPILELKVNVAGQIAQLMGEISKQNKMRKSWRGKETA